MATIREYLQLELAGLKMPISNERLDFFGIRQGIDLDQEYTQLVSKGSDLILLAIIPSILARPDVTEGDWSEKFDRGAVLKYMAYLRYNNEIPDPLAEKEPTIEDASHFW